jgi:glycosyltransferase involved in cell wall biosynthesis
MDRAADTMQIMPKNFKKMAIIRSSSYVLSQDSYNIQEIGLAKALLALGVSTDVYMAGNTKRPAVSTVFENNGEIARLHLLPHLRLPGRQAIFPDLYKLMDEHDYDLLQVHEESQITSVHVALYGRSRSIPVVLCQGMYREYYGVIKRLVQTIYDMTMLRLLRKNTSLCIAKTGWARNYLHTKNLENVRVCPVGLDTGKFAEYEPVDWMDRYGVRKDEKVLLYVGIIEKRRRVHGLINTLRNLLHGRQDLYLFIAGDGPDRARCEKLVAQLNLRGKVLFLGKIPQKQLPSLYKAAYLFLMPSRYEIYGMVMLESMYFGTPVVSTATAGSDEVITDGVDGMVLNSSNIDAWEQAIDGLLSNRDRRNEMGMRARETVLSKYTWDRASLQYHDAYLSAIRDYRKEAYSPHHFSGRPCDPKTIK